MITLRYGAENAFFLLWIKQLINFLNVQLIVWFKRLHKIFICVSQRLKVKLYFLNPRDTAKH